MNEFELSYDIDAVSVTVSNMDYMANFGDPTPNAVYYPVAAVPVAVAAYVAVVAATSVAVAYNVAAAINLNAAVNIYQTAFVSGGGM